MAICNSSITVREDDEREHKPPSYGVPGRLLVEIEQVNRNPRSIYAYSAVLYDYDADTSVFWLCEGVGIEFFLDEQVDLEDEGWYVFEGVVGHYHRGDGWSTDDDEEWEYATCRRARPSEIQSACLDSALKEKNDG